MQTVYEIRKSNLLEILEQFGSRKAFCERLGIEYNLLNQYLGKKSQKNIGDKFAARVTESLNVPTGWLDHPHDKLAIKNIIQSQVATDSVVHLSKTTDKVENHPSIDQSNALRMVSLSNILKMSKGENLELSANTEEIKNIHVPVGMINPIAYLIKGTGFAKPYRNGYAVVCEYTGQPIAGEEVLIFCKNGSIYAGEYLFEQDGLVKIDSVEGALETLQKDSIDRISPVKMFISPSQIK